MSPALLLWVALGGAVGAPLRVLVTHVCAGTSLGRPLGTLTVNVVGSLLLGAFGSWSARQGEGSQPALAAFFALGLLGSFTTFSTFAVESLSLGSEKGLGVGILHVGVTLATCLPAAALGAWLFRA